MESQIEQVKTLIKKASEQEDAAEAMKFAQAAVNAANALCALNIATQGK